MTFIDVVKAYDKLQKMYEEYMTPLYKKYLINKTGFDLIMFISHYPEYNTARDACRYRGIKSGMASVAIDILLGMGYVEQVQDEVDKRMMRLVTTKKSEPLIEEGRQFQKSFIESFFSVLSSREKDNISEMLERLFEHINEMSNS